MANKRALLHGSSDKSSRNLWLNAFRLFLVIEQDHQKIYCETYGQMSVAAVLVLLTTALLAHKLGLVKTISCAIVIFILKLLEKIFVLKWLCIAFLSRVNTAVIHFIFSPRFWSFFASKLNIAIALVVHMVKLRLGAFSAFKRIKTSFLFGDELCWSVESGAFGDIRFKMQTFVLCELNYARCMLKETGYLTAVTLSWELQNSFEGVMTFT